MSAKKADGKAVRFSIRFSAPAGTQYQLETRTVQAATAPAGEVAETMTVPGR